MLEWIISSSILIKLIIILRLLLKGKISPRLQYALWALVLIRLIVPVNIGSSNLSVANIVNLITENDSSFMQTTVEYAEDKYTEDNNGLNQELIQEHIQNDQTATSNSVSSDIAAYQPERSEGELYALPAQSHLDIYQIIMIIWASGAAIVFAWFVICNIVFGAKLRKNRKVLEQKNTNLPVYISETAESPCLFGILMPSIYISKNTPSDEDTLRHVIIHEETHFHHCDHIIGLLKGLCLAVHWFNPLVWLASFLSRLDSEMACDESTVIRLGETEREAYGRTLIDMTAASKIRFMLNATTMTGTKKSIYERIRMIASGRKKKIGVAIVATVAALLAAGCTFAGAKNSSKHLVVAVDYSSIGEAFEICRDLEASADENFSEVLPLINRKEDGDTYTYTFEVKTKQEEYWIHPAVVYTESDAEHVEKGKLQENTYLSSNSMLCLMNLN